MCAPFQRGHRLCSLAWTPNREAHSEATRRQLLRDRVRIELLNVPKVAMTASVHAQERSAAAAKGSRRGDGRVRRTGTACVRACLS
eukprot:498522-Pleurochrysis_carterae.AAC.1